MVAITANPTIPPITPPAIAPAEDELNIKHIYAPLIKLINEYIVTDRQRNDKKKKVKKKENKEIKSFVKYLFCATMLLSDRCLLLKYELQ